MNFMMCEKLLLEFQFLFFIVFQNQNAFFEQFFLINKINLILKLSKFLLPSVHNLLHKNTKFSFHNDPGDNIANIFSLMTIMLFELYPRFPSIKFHYSQSVELLGLSCQLFLSQLPLLLLTFLF